MKIARLFLGSLGFLSSIGYASSEADARYAFKSILALVVNADQESVHSQHVQAEIEKYFQSRPRFEINAAAQNALKAELVKAPLPDLSEMKEDALTPVLALARSAGADSVLLAQVQKLGDSYQIAFLAAVPEPGELIFQKVVKVNDRYALASFGAATQEGLSSFVQSLPYDATVLSREGYRVVIDRGAPSFKQGTRVAIFTLEKGEVGFELKETGVILLNRVEKNLSFGTILVENKPLEVTKGNKVRFHSLGTLSPETPLADRTFRPQPLSRDIASVPDAITGEYAFQKEKWGFVDVQFVGNLISWSRTAASTGAYRSDTGFYPGASVRAQVKLTRDAFAELGGMFGVSSLGTTATGTSVNLSSQSNQVRAMVGYRLALSGSGYGPSVFVRAGYSRTQFQVDELPNFLAPSSAIFSGMLLGGGFDFPFSDTVGAGLEMNGLAFSSLSEGGGTSGAETSGLAAWDFSVRGYYHLTDKINLEGRLMFQTHTASFSGQGTRPVALASLSQTTRALLAGISYYY